MATTFWPMNSARACKHKYAAVNSIEVQCRCGAPTSLRYGGYSPELWRRLPNLERGGGPHEQVGFHRRPVGAGVD